MSSKRMSRCATSVLGVVFAVSVFIGFSGGIGMAECGDEAEFTTDFRLADCKFRARGVNPYFNLEPGFQLVLENEEEGSELEIKVLNRTKRIDLRNEGIGWVRARVVREREWDEDGNLTEVSWNYFALCEQTNALYYFGEDVNIYNYTENGDFIDITHEGAWLAGEDEAFPGLMMPGTFLLGSKYFQEIAPGVALDRGENVEMDLTYSFEEETFEGCVKVEETSSINCEDESEKMYCPGIGLVVDDDFELVDHGFENPRPR